MAERLAALWFARQAGDALLHGNAEHAARCQQYARLLERCATLDSWRCGRPVCPRCECRAAKRYRVRQEARLRKPGAFALVTLTLPCDDLRSGAQALWSTFAELRRRALWSGVAGVRRTCK